MRHPNQSVEQAQAMLDDIADLPYDQQVRYLDAMTRSVSVPRQRLARVLLLNSLDQLADDHPRHARA